MDDIKKGLSEEELKTARERFEKYNEMCDLYNSNAEFRQFVDKNCKTYNLHKDICLLHATVQEVGEYYEHKNDDKVDICPCGREEIELEDKSC